MADQGANIKKAFKDTYSKDGYDTIVSEILNLEEYEEIEKDGDTASDLESLSENTDSSHFIYNLSGSSAEDSESNSNVN